MGVIYVRKYKKFILLIAAVFVSMIFIAYRVDADMKEEARVVESELDAYRFTAPTVFEYDTKTINLNDYVQKGKTKEQHKITVDPLNSEESLSCVGDHVVNVHISAVDKYNREYEKTLSHSFKIVDTQFPIIDVNETDLSITEGDPLVFDNCINRIYDVIDGDLEYSEVPKSGAYWFENIPDNNEPGEYKVNLSAEDINGNRSTQQINVTIKKKIVYPTGVSQDSNGVIHVNFDQCFSTVGASPESMQSLLDQGYIIHYYGDYFHHNTSGFLNLFWKCKSGAKVTVNGNTYTSEGIYHGWCTDTEIYYDSGGLSWYDNPAVEMITCDGDRGTNQRWILILY